MKKNIFDLHGCRALVTGSGGGLGFALARGLAEAGASIILNGRNVDKLEAAAKILRGEGYNVTISAFDVTDEVAVNVAIGELLLDGDIDILVNNAGMQFRGALETFPTDKWRQIMATNVDSAFFVARAVVPHMISAGAGKIINICSLMSDLGRASITPYATSKGAIKMLTRGMCADWAKHNIQINGIAPGYFRTEMNTALVEDKDFTNWLEARTPAGRWGEPDELVGAAVFLAAPASRFVNGQIIFVDGGLSAAV